MRNLSAGIFFLLGVVSLIGGVYFMNILWAFGSNGFLETLGGMFMAFVPGGLLILFAVILLRKHVKQEVAQNWSLKGIALAKIVKPIAWFGLIASVALSFLSFFVPLDFVRSISRFVGGISNFVFLFSAAILVYLSSNRQKINPPDSLEESGDSSLGMEEGTSESH